MFNDFCENYDILTFYAIKANCAEAKAIEIEK